MLIEAKLWAEKSGSGEHDQLVRYLKILDDLTAFDFETQNEGCTSPCAVLLYLTARDSLPEIAESHRLWGAGRPGFDRLFRAQWQDIVTAAWMLDGPVDRISRMILADVSSFLAARRLEYFGGFRRESVLPFVEAEGAFYNQASKFAGFVILRLSASDQGAGAYYARHGLFRGFQRCSDLDTFACIGGRWTR